MDKELSFEAAIGGTHSHGRYIVNLIADRLRHARKEHPASEWRGKGRYWALGQLGSEFEEVVHAVENEGDDRMVDELLDLIAVALRMLQREYE